MTAQSISISISLSEYGVKSAQEIETDVVDSLHLRLSLVGSSVPFVELSFPCKIDDDTVTAKYRSRTGVLVVSAQPAAAPSHPKAADIQVQQGHGDASGMAVPPCIPGVGEPGPPGRSPGRASLVGSPVGNSEASDAALMRDFADEAYMVSLTIGDTLASAQRQQQPMTSEQPGSTERAEVGGQGSSPQSQQGAEVTNSGASMATQPTTGVETSASGSRVAAAEAPGPKMQDGEGPVRMAAGISGVGLAAQLGYPFSAPSTSAPSAGNAKKAKKRERKKATDAAAATLQQLADSLQTQGWAVCGEELGGHNVTTACCPMPHAPCALR